MAEEKPKLRLSNSALESAFKNKPHLQQYVSRLKELDKNNTGELSLEEVAECVQELVSYEGSSRMYKKVVLTVVVLLVLAVAAIVGLTFTVVRLSQPMWTENGVLMSSGGVPVVVSRPMMVVSPVNNTASGNITTSGNSRRRALLGSRTSFCYPDRIGIIPLETLMTTCDQIQAGSSTVLIVTGDPTCTDPFCASAYASIEIRYEHCSLLTNPPASLLSCSNNEVYSILGGVDTLDPNDTYQVDLQFDCLEQLWINTATIVHGVCSLSSVAEVAASSASASIDAPAPQTSESSAADAPSPSPSQESPSPAADVTAPSPSPSPSKESPSPDAPPPSPEPKLPPGVLYPCKKGEFWDYTRSICTESPIIEYCTRVQYKDTYTPDCQACKEYFTVRNGMCICDASPTFLTSDGHCLCRNDPRLIPLGQFYPGITEQQNGGCTKSLEVNIQAKCKVEYDGLACEYANVVENF